MSSWITSKYVFIHLNFEEGFQIENENFTGFGKQDGGFHETATDSCFRSELLVVYWNRKIIIAYEYIGMHISVRLILNMA